MSELKNLKSFYYLLTKSPREFWESIIEGFSLLIGRNHLPEFQIKMRKVHII